MIYVSLIQQLQLSSATASRIEKVHAIFLDPEMEVMYLAARSPLPVTLTLIENHQLQMNHEKS